MLNNKDQGKYKLLEFKEPLDKVIMLNGSHWIFDSADWNLINEVMSDGITKIKVHPATSEATQKWMEDKYGKDRIIDRYISGFQVMLNSETIYITSLTEFNIWCIIYGKKIKSLQPKNRKLNTIFEVLHDSISDNIEENKILLNKLLNGKSGLIFPQYNINWKNDMKELVDYYIEERNSFIGI
jgi:hypothetical protein